MKQKEFEELSKKEVKELNGGDESAQEAWRAGYIYVQQQIKKIEESSACMEDYIDKLEELSNQNLDYFEK